MQKFKTCKRFNNVGHAHFLTFPCFQGKPLLSKDRSRQWMVDSIARARETHQFDLWAYVIMPNHVHLLIMPQEPNYSISRILISLKKSVANRAIIFCKRETPAFLTQLEDRQPNGKMSYRFWQRGGGFDSNLTEMRIIQQTIDYIHANPVRRQLCERPTDWKWSSASEMKRSGSGLLKLNLESIPAN